ncbi:DNA repair exonuclease [Sinimarinibacterium sp. NLF-5-8]|uniref:metallophosphoesterase family protein n=1 Tax=Sinimarinibacterium sp. NLF-5-8 TaxID=2698684 RepID=UPI00137C39DC|nr:DNA repair exonuclease [Sinimarinibacterium sp. NLF-5-8]QHS10580.1 DNA repair exonuclease [Sinimarinibacterium sp. NLF-5-8]
MKFLHTADWQLGIKLRHLSDENAAQMRLLRYQTIEKIAAVARAQAADFVLVAGDVMDDNALGKDALQKTVDALRAFAGLPVFLLPGNHDAATEDSALARLALPQNVHFLQTRAPVAVPGGTLFACPLTRRHTLDDPTAWLPRRSREDGISIAMAHGGVLNFSEGSDSAVANLINAEAVIAKGYDYLAMGDWHGLYRHDARVWYSGAHEATRFKEKNPGHVLMVEIAAPGAEPIVTPVGVAQTQWLKWQIHFTEDHQVDTLAERLAQLEKPSQTLLRIELSGTLSLPARQRCDALLEDYAERLVHLRLRGSGILTQPSDADLAQMGGEPFLDQVIRDLRSGDNAEDCDALLLLYRLQQEAHHAAA